LTFRIKLRILVKISFFSQNFVFGRKFVFLFKNNLDGKRDDKKGNKERRRKQKEYTEQDVIYKDAKKKIRVRIELADLQQLFPGFRPDRALKFLKLFENAPSNDYPNPWRYLTNKKSREVTDPCADIQKMKSKKLGMQVQ